MCVGWTECNKAGAGRLYVKSRTAVWPATSQAVSTCLIGHASVSHQSRAATTCASASRGSPMCHGHAGAAKRMRRASPPTEALFAFIGSLEAAGAHPQSLRRAVGLGCMQWLQDFPAARTYNTDRGPRLKCPTHSALQLAWVEWLAKRSLLPFCRASTTHAMLRGGGAAEQSQDGGQAVAHRVGIP